MVNRKAEKGIYYNRWGDGGELSFGPLPDSLAVDPDKMKLRRGMILVRVRAVSVNPVDWKIMSGAQKIVASRHFPRIFGTDFSGEVIKSGPGSSFVRGDRVWGMVSPLTSGSGRQWLTVRAKHCLPIPEQMSFTEAASLPAAGISALLASSPALKRSPGRALLIGASGGVGSLALQILTAHRWKITAVAREGQCEMLRARGCDDFLDRKTWKSELEKEWDLILDSPGALIRENPGRFLKKGGVYSPVYIPDPFIAQQIFRSIVWFFTSRRTGLFLAYPSVRRLKKLENLIKGNIVTPLIDSVWTGAECRSAVEKSMGSGVCGKIVIEI